MSNLVLRKFLSKLRDEDRSKAFLQKCKNHSRHRVYCPYCNTRQIKKNHKKKLRCLNSECDKTFNIRSNTFLEFNYTMLLIRDWLLIIYLLEYNPDGISLDEILKMVNSTRRNRPKLKSYHVINIIDKITEIKKQEDALMLNIISNLGLL